MTGGIPHASPCHLPTLRQIRGTSNDGISEPTSFGLGPIRLATAPSVNDAPAYCAQCGAANADLDGRFCMQCGSILTLSPVIGATTGGSVPPTPVHPDDGLTTSGPASPPPSAQLAATLGPRRVRPGNAVRAHPRMILFGTLVLALIVAAGILIAEAASDSPDSEAPIVHGSASTLVSVIWNACKSQISPKTETCRSPPPQVLSFCNAFLPADLPTVGPAALATPTLSYDGVPITSGPLGVLVPHVLVGGDSSLGAMSISCADATQPNWSLMVTLPSSKLKVNVAPDTCGSNPTARCTATSAGDISTNANANGDFRDFAGPAAVVDVNVSDPGSATQSADADELFQKALTAVDAPAASVPSFRTLIHPTGAAASPVTSSPPTGPSTSAVPSASAITTPPPTTAQYGLTLTVGPEDTSACSSTAFGQVATYLDTNNCQEVTRSLYTATATGRPVLISAVEVIFSAGTDPQPFISLITANGTGDVRTLLDDGGPLASSMGYPAAFAADPTFLAQPGSGSGNVIVLEAMWADGVTTQANDPGLVPVLTALAAELT